ncbi:MAG: hypothetical protein ACI936_002674 [Paraglaciecola sp.]|jgi:hypothetical protein
MDITSQTQILAQRLELQHGGVFGFNGPSNSVVPNVVGQFNQQFEQSSNDAQFFIGNTKGGIKGNVKRITTRTIIRVRLVMHDACVLSFQVIEYSLDSALVGCIEQNELHFWKRDQGVISND